MVQRIPMLPSPRFRHFGCVAVHLVTQLVSVWMSSCSSSPHTTSCHPGLFQCVFAKRLSRTSAWFLLITGSLVLLSPFCKRTGIRLSCGVLQNMRV